jgi:hypothetical protein
MTCLKGLALYSNKGGRQIGPLLWGFPLNLPWGSKLSFRNWQPIAKDRKLFVSLFCARC